MEVQCVRCYVTVSVASPSGAAERRRGLHGVHGPPQQGPEPGAGDRRAHRQRLHEEEGEPECGGGAHQAGHQTQRCPDVAMETQSACFLS